MQTMLMYQVSRETSDRQAPVHLRIQRRNVTERVTQSLALPKRGIDAPTLTQKFLGAMPTLADIGDGLEGWDAKPFW